MTRRISVAVLVSGGGTNLGALLDAQNTGKLGCAAIRLVISSSENAGAVERAKKHGIKTLVLTKREHPTAEAYDNALRTTLKGHGIELVVLAGYLKIIGVKTLAAYKNRMINIHPSLLPSFCGDGFYGLKVHEAALSRGVKISGATVHFVSEIVDGGEILMQKPVHVYKTDTPEKLQKRIMKQAEWIILPKVVAMLCEDIKNEKCEEERDHGKEEGVDKRRGQNRSHGARARARGAGLRNSVHGRYGKVSAG